MSNTTNSLLAKLRARCRWPATGGPLTDAQLLEMMDDQLQSEVFPRVLEAKEDYRVYHIDYPIEAGQAEYRIPPRAHAGRLKDVVLLEQDLTSPVSLAYVDLSETAHSGFDNGGRWLGTSFCFRDDWVRLHPVPNVANGRVLRLYYYMRPGELVLEADARKITDVQTTVVPSTGWGVLFAPIASWSQAASFDVIGATGGFPTNAAGATVFGVEPGHPDPAEGFAVLGLLPAGVAVGDWVAMPGESPIPQIPDVAHPLLLARTATVALKSVGDRPGAADQADIADRAESKLIGLLSNRVDGEAKIITPDYGPLRQAGAHRRRWR